ELRVAYQPIVALGDGVIRGFEALVRWEHPDRGLLSPAQFIPVAEESGMIVALGRVVLEEACRQSAQWSALHGPVPIHVNLSARSGAWRARSISRSSPRAWRPRSTSTRCAAWAAGWARATSSRGPSMSPRRQRSW